MSATLSTPAEGAISSPPSLDTVLAERYDAFQATPDAVDSRQSAEPVAQEPAGGTPPRDAAGRFLPVDQSTEEVPPAPAQVAPAEAPSSPVSPPPESWSPEQKAHWEKLDPALQTFLSQRENESQTQRQIVARYRDLDETLAPHRAQWTTAGTTDAQAIKTLLAAQNYLQRDPIGGLRWLARSYGIHDLSQVAPVPSGQQSSGEAPQTALDPAVAITMDRVGRLEQSLNAHQAIIQEQQRAHVMAEVEAFAKTHPHLDVIAQDVARLIQTGAAPDLATAYETAVWANPTTRAALLSEQQQAQASAAQAEAEKAAKAAAAARSVDVQGTAASPRQKPGSLEDHLSAAWDRINGR